MQLFGKVTRHQSLVTYVGSVTFLDYLTVFMVYKLVMYLTNNAISLLDRRRRLKMPTINFTFNMHTFL